MKKYFAWPLLTAILTVSITLAQAAAETSTPNAGTKSAESHFNETAGVALQAMVQRAQELNMKGVAVLAYVPGDDVQSWSSKMKVVKSLKNEPSGNNKGANLLAIAYSKAAEMADTLKDSGSGIRPPMTGEFGWQGGLIKKVKTGYLIAAFSGGSGEDDVRVSRVGLELLAGKL